MPLRRHIQFRVLLQLPKTALRPVSIELVQRGQLFILVSGRDTVVTTPIGQSALAAAWLVVLVLVVWSAHIAE